MSLAIEFTAFGIPKGQPRPRATIRGRHAGVYDPGTAESWKNAVRHAAKEVWGGKPFAGPLCVRICCRMPRPKAHRRSNGELKESAPSWHTGKPDCDNIAKAILDALTTIGLWADDAQVAKVVIAKRYDDGAPGAFIQVREMAQ